MLFEVTSILASIFIAWEVLNRYYYQSIIRTLTKQENTLKLIEKAHDKENLNNDRALDLLTRLIMATEFLAKDAESTPCNSLQQQSFKMINTIDPLPFNVRRKASELKKQNTNETSMMSIMVTFFRIMVAILFGLQMLTFSIALAYLYDVVKNENHQLTDQNLIIGFVTGTLTGIICGALKFVELNELEKTIDEQKNRITALWGLIDQRTEHAQRAEERYESDQAIYQQKLAAIKTSNSTVATAQEQAITTFPRAKFEPMFVEMQKIHGTMNAFLHPQQSHSSITIERDSTSTNEDITLATRNTSREQELTPILGSSSNPNYQSMSESNSKEETAARFCCC